MNRLKMAVVGVGALGRHHARILSELDEADLVAVAETNPAIGQKVALDCGTRWVTDYRELLDEIDAVSIVVPTSAHLDVASEFLMRRIPVLVEKPLAQNLDDAETLVSLSQRHGTLMQVGHVERFNPATEVAVANCGNPKYIRGERLSPYAFRSTDIGAIHDLMIHDIELVLHLAQSAVRRVEALGVSILGGNEDSVQARVTFESGCIADLTASRVHPSSRRAMQIWSEDNTLTVDFHSREVIRYTPSETLRYGTPVPERAKQPGANVEQLKQDVFGKFLHVEQLAVPQQDALTEELRSFIDCVQHDKTPRVGAREALQAMQLAEQIRDSVTTHAWDGHAGGAVGPFFNRPREQKRAA